MHTSLDFAAGRQHCCSRESRSMHAFVHERGSYHEHIEGMALIPATFERPLYIGPTKTREFLVFLCNTKVSVVRGLLPTTSQLQFS